MQVLADQAQWAVCGRQGAVINLDQSLRWGGTGTGTDTDTDTDTTTTTTTTSPVLS